MKLSTTLPIIVGGAATLVAVNFFKAKPEPKPQYVIAASAIPSNYEIKENLLIPKEWTETRPMPEGYIPWEHAQQLKDRFTKRKIDKNAAVTENDLWMVGVDSRLVAKLREDPNYVAYSMRVDEFTGGGGFVRPGDRVHVQATGLPVGDGRQSLPLTRTIMKSVEVLAVNQIVSPVKAVENEKDKAPRPRSQPTSVTLLVTLAQSEVLRATETYQGVKLWLLPAAEGADPSDTQGATIASAIGQLMSATAKPTIQDEPQPKRSQALQATKQIEVVRGTQVSQDVFVHQDGAWVRADQRPAGAASPAAHQAGGAEEPAPQRSPE